MVAHAFKPGPKKQRQEDLFEFDASWVYTASSRKVTNATEKPFLRLKK